MPENQDLTNQNKQPPHQKKPPASPAADKQSQRQGKQPANGTPPVKPTPQKDKNATPDSKDPSAPEKITELGQGTKSMSSLKERVKTKPSPESATDKANGDDGPSVQDAGLTEKSDPPADTKQPKSIKGDSHTDNRSSKPAKSVKSGETTAEPASATPQKPPKEKPHTEPPHQQEAPPEETSDKEKGAPASSTTPSGETSGDDEKDTLETEPQKQGPLGLLKNKFGELTKSKGPSPAQKQADKFAEGLVNLKDLLAPSAVEIDFNHLQIGENYYKTYFITGFPREVGANWLAPLINFSHALDIGMFYYPVKAKEILSQLRRKITELESELSIEHKEGRLLDPKVQLALQDARELQEELTAEREKFFQFALYITVPADDKEELNVVSHQLESILSSIMLVPRKATLQMDTGFKTTIPSFNDGLKVTRNMDTTSIATTLPFTSSSLSSDQGIMYGINEHNGSLIIFDRFQMENANSVIFGTSGSGKSYLVKLEALRSLMLGVDVIIIDPENEYKRLCDAIGGTYIHVDFNSASRINPFDLAQGYRSEENELNLKILSLHTLFKIMLGDMNSSEEAILDKALLMTYRMKGITQNAETHSLEPPLLEDLYKVLLGMENESAAEIANRLEKYVVGSAKGLFNRHTNIDLDNTFIAFGIRDLPDNIRPVGMFLILDYIWNRIRWDRKKRLLIVDEAWLLMEYPDSAHFLHSVARRGRKYYLGLTTITQQIDEFLSREKGKAIVNNAAIRILMKQSSSAIDQLAEVFYLSQGEKNLLLSSNVGEGIFFAGKAHVAMQVVASQEEHALITSNPAELKAMAAE